MIIKGKIEKKDIPSPFAKAVVDIKRQLISVGCELHIDCAEELIKDTSRSEDLWGINIYPNGEIDFISLINIRPSANNRGMEIQIQEIRETIKKIVEKFLSL